MTLPLGSIVCFLDEKDTREWMLIGGFYMPRADLARLDERIIKIKGDFGLPPQTVVKWNLKDKACQIAWPILRNQVGEFREAFLALISELKAKILVSMVWKGDPKYTQDSWKWAFENVLQRLCIVLDRKKRELNEEHQYPFLDVVFDWLPKRGKVDGYFQVYSEAYWEGYKFISNRLPALRQHQACPCLLVTSTRHSLGLQLADHIVGSTGDFFRWMYKGERDLSVRRHFVAIYPFFHSDSRGNILGMGLVVPKSARSKVEEGLGRLGFNR